MSKRELISSSILWKFSWNTVFFIIVHLSVIVIDLVGGLFDTLQGILGYLEDTGRTMHLVEREQNHNVSDTVNLCMQAWVNYADIAFLPRVSYAKRGICRRRVSVCVCVCVSVCLSHSGIVSKRLNVESRK